MSTASAAQPEALLAWTRFGLGAAEAQPGTDLIKTLGGPLGPGRSTAWIQQLGSETHYEFGLQASLLSGQPADGSVANPEATSRRDLLTGHPLQSDVFRLSELTDSLLRDYDTITDFETENDKIEVGDRSYRSRVDQILLEVSMTRPLGTLNDLSDREVRSYLRADVFAQNAAVAVRVDGCPCVFLALNDKTHGFQLNRDAILHIDNHRPMNALSITIF